MTRHNAGGVHRRLLDTEKLDAVIRALKSGITKAAVSRTFGVKRSTLLNTLARIGWQGPGRTGTRAGEA